MSSFFCIDLENGKCEYFNTIYIKQMNYLF